MIRSTLNQCRLVVSGERTYHVAGLCLGLSEPKSERTEEETNVVCYSGNIIDAREDVFIPRISLITNDVRFVSVLIKSLNHFNKRLTGPQANLQATGLAKYLLAKG